jgi:chemotaxis response regulator CheB
LHEIIGVYCSYPLNTSFLNDRQIATVSKAMEEKPKPRKKKSLTKVLLPVKPSDYAESKGTRFLIIGIGASAGGLEALELFLKHVPPASVMVFVIVQHLDPTHTGIMAELLQRSTPMPVCQITDNLPVKKNHVYVIPPNKDLFQNALCTNKTITFSKKLEQKLLDFEKRFNIIFTTNGSGFLFPG